jgi:DNA-binding transcriptional LysR family regulator
MQMFVRVVEAGSFAAAAEISHVTATMAAKHIREIEQRLGAKLIHRTTRTHQLTETGALYYERCKRALYEFEQAEASAEELRSSPRGRLRIVAPVSFGSETLAPVLADYLDRHPEVRVDLTLDNAPVDLIRERYHLAIHIGALDSNEVVARPLQAYRRILAAAPSYLARHGQPEAPEQLRDHCCLGLSYWRNKEFFWTLSGPEQQIRHVPVDGRFTANDGRALRAAALQGMGIVLLPEMLLASDLATDQLRPILPAWCHAPTPMYLVHARDQRPTAMLRSAIDFLAERFAAPRMTPHA